MMTNITSIKTPHAISTELVATFDFEEMSNYRYQIPCFRDRRPEVYGHLP